MELAWEVSLLALHFLKVLAFKLELVELPCLSHTTGNQDCLARIFVSTTVPERFRKFIAIENRHLHNLMTRRQPLIAQIFNGELLDLELRHVHLKDLSCAAIVGGVEHSLCTVVWL